jgi:hypothetical protein
MALQPHRLEFKSHRLEFILGMVLAMAVTILTITTWAAPPPLLRALRRSRRFTGLTTRICTRAIGYQRPATSRTSCYTGHTVTRSHAANAASKLGGYVMSTEFFASK